MLLLVILLAVIAVATYLLARRRTREAIMQRRRADQLEEKLDVWVEAEQRGLARPKDEGERLSDRNGP